MKTLEVLSGMAFLALKNIYTFPEFSVKFQQELNFLNSFENSSD